MEWTWHWSADPQVLERASVLAHQALALDDFLPEAHSLLSGVYAQQQQFEQAIAESERAIALNPNDAYSYAYQANTLLFAGRPEEALRAVTQAMRFDPHYPPWYLMTSGAAYRLTGRWAEAIATSKEAIRQNPNFLPAYVILGHSYLMQWISQQNSEVQTLESAVAAGQRALALNDSYPWNHIYLGFIYLNQQEYEQALAEMERTVALAPTEARSYAALAAVLSCMGRTEAALEAAAQALRLKPTLWMAT
jgi:tetratricopeptide (TPR) repeat protein